MHSSTVSTVFFRKCKKRIWHDFCQLWDIFQLFPWKRIFFSFFLAFSKVMICIIYSLESILFIFLFYSFSIWTSWSSMRLEFLDSIYSPFLIEINHFEVVHVLSLDQKKREFFCMRVYSVSMNDVVFNINNLARVIQNNKTHAQILIGKL